MIFTAEAFAIRLGEQLEAKHHQSYLHLEGCGSFKAAENTLITSGHCLHHKTKSKDDLLLHPQFQKGSALRMRTIDDQIFQIKVSEVIFHPSYLANIGNCEHVEACMDIAMIRLDSEDDNIWAFRGVETAVFAKDEQINHQEPVELVGAGAEHFEFQWNNLISGVFYVDSVQAPIALEEQKLKSYFPSAIYENDFEIAIYPETASFFNREAPILLKGDSGAPVFNAQGEVIAINSHSNYLNGRSVAKKIHAKVSVPVLEWLNGIDEI